MCRKFQRYARRQTNRQTQTSRYSVPLSGAEWWFQVVAFSVLCPFVDVAFSFLTLLVGRQEGHPALKTEWWGAGVVICLERDADLHMAQLMPLPLVVSCFSKIQIGTFLVPAHLGSPGQGAVKRVCVCPFVDEVSQCKSSGHLSTIKGLNTVSAQFLWCDWCLCFRFTALQKNVEKEKEWPSTPWTNREKWCPFSVSRQIWRIGSHTKHQIDACALCGLRGVMCFGLDFWFRRYIYCLLVYVVCFPTFPFFLHFSLSPPLLVISFEKRPVPFTGQMP